MILTITVFINGKLNTDGNALLKDEDLICFIPETEMQYAKDNHFSGVDLLIEMTMHGNEASRFESHVDYDLICLQIPSFAGDNTFNRVLVYLEKKKAIFIYRENEVIEQLIDQIKERELMSISASIEFFKILMHNDTAILDNIEDSIAGYEELLTDSIPKDMPQRISQLRRKLLIYKKYYDTVFTMLEDMEENSNSILSARQLKALHIQTNKAFSLSHSVQNLRDYVTQLREAYQAQMDIQLNNIMKIFTVITTIFLPLTLIVGWYGMNIYMPELVFQWMYPVIIGLSIIIVVVSIIFFKHKKWF